MSNCLVVMQPTFLPWAGYFNLMAQSDDFVFLDDVQLEKQSWQTRNRLLFGGVVHWISVPVRQQRLTQTIVETEVVDATRWREKLAKGFSQNYGRHSNYAEASEVIDVILTSSSQNLADLNETVIRFITEELNLSPRLHRARDFVTKGVRSERLIALCSHFGANEYLAPIGSAEYLAQDRFAQRAPANLRFQSYTPQPYKQRNSSEFVPYLSILDVVANLGWDATLDYVQGGGKQ